MKLLTCDMARYSLWLPWTFYKPWVLNAQLTFYKWFLLFLVRFILTFLVVVVVVVVQSLSHVQLFTSPWTAAHQASLSFTISQSLLKLISIELVMPSNHLILCRPLLFLSSIFPIIRVYSNELALCISWPKYWSFSFRISPFSEHECWFLWGLTGLVSF